MDLLAAHNDVVRERLTRFGGRELATTGDGFLCLFDAVEAAVRVGLAIVAAMPALDLRLRAGVHTGEVEQEGAMYVGWRSTSDRASSISPARAKSSYRGPRRTCLRVPGSTSSTADCMS